MEGYRGDVYAWKDTEATLREAEYMGDVTRGRIQGRRVRVEGYRGDVYAWKDTGATPTRGRIYRDDVNAWEDTGASCTRGRTPKGGAILARGRREPIRTKGQALWYSRYT